MSKEREAFEAWLLGCGNADEISFEKLKAGARVFDEYANKEIESMWLAWKARAAVDRASLEAVPDVDAIAQFIRTVDGNHDMGASALAERLHEWLTAAPAQPEQQSEKGKNDVELDRDSSNPITGQQRDLARALEVGQRVVQSRKQDRSDPDAEKELNLIVKALAAPIAVEVAKNCRSVPQLTFPHIALGLTDLILSVTQANTDQPAQQERQPMTEEEIERGRKETFSTNNPFCPCDSKTMLKAVRWAERHHGIRKD